MNKERISIYIVDDNDAVRDALTLLVESVGLKATAFSSAQDFLKAYNDEFAGCLVLDIRMPGMSGIQLQEELNRRSSKLPIIFITGHGDIPMAVQAVKAGAIDFIPKPFRDQELLDCIQNALQKYQQTKSLDDARLDLELRLESLTPRERGVLTLVVEGMSNKQIAAKLKVSQRTVEVHRSHMMEKMQVNSIAELVKQVTELQG